MPHILNRTSSNLPIHKIYGRLSVALLLSLLFLLTLFGSLVSAHSASPTETQHQSTAKPVKQDFTLPLTYARVLTDHVPVYSSPLQISEGLSPVRTLGSGYLWVSLVSTQPISAAGQLWYHINEEEYVPMQHLAPYTPSQFRGITITTQPTQPFAWLVYYVRPSLTPGVILTDTPWFIRYDRVTISATTQVTDWRWYQVDGGYWLDERNLSVVRPLSRPAGVGPNEKWLEVDLFEQNLVVYEGDRMVYATLVSSGLPRWPTETGLHRLWTKIKMGKMSGGIEGDDYYFVEDVPWTMYFTGTYGLHGAYWHDSFGFPHSHGCVNMTLTDAKWLFDWVTPAAGINNWTFPTDDDPGTWVYVHEGDKPIDDSEEEIVDSSEETLDKEVIVEQ